MTYGLASHRARLRTAILSSCGLLALATCSDPTGPDVDVVPEPIVVAIADTSITFSTVGATRDIAVTVTQGGAPVARPLAWWSSFDATASVNGSGRVLARARGSTVIYALTDSGGLDSVRVNVLPVVASITLPAPVSLLVGRTRELIPLVTDSAGFSLGNPRLTWTSTDTLVASVDNQGNVLARSTGSATIRVAFGSIQDSVPVTVRPLPPIRFAVDTLVLTTGAPLIGTPAVFIDSLMPEQTVTVSVAVADTSIAWATDSFPLPTPFYGAPILQFAGRALGTTTAVISSPGRPSASVVLVVRPPQLGGSRRYSIDVAYPAIGSSETVGGWGSYLQSASGGPVLYAAPRWVHFASLDTSIIKVLVDSATTTGAEPAITQFRILRTGTGTLVATSPSVLPETVDVRTIERRVYINRYWYGVSADTVGVDYRHRVRAGTTGFVPMNQTLTLNVSQRRPDLLALSSTSLLRTSLDFEPELSYVGLAEGVDTLIISAPGHGSDTLVVRVRAPTLPKPDTPDTLGFTQFLRFTAPIDEWAGASPLRLRISSSDSSVLLADVAQVTVNIVNQYEFVFVRRGPGIASLTLTDESGRHPPLVFDPIEVRRSGLHLYAPDLPAGGATLGVRQQRSLGIETPWAEGAWRGRLRSTDTSIVRVSIDSFPTLPRAFAIEGGDVPGTAWVIAEGTGFRPDSMLVRVTPGLIDLGPSRQLPSAMATPTSPLNVLIRDASGNVRETRDSLFVLLRTTDRRRLTLLDSIVTIPPGASASSAIRYRTGVPGNVVVSVIPIRPFRAGVEASSTGFSIIQVTPGVQSLGGAPDD